MAREASAPWRPGRHAGVSCAALITARRQRRRLAARLRADPQVSSPATLRLVIALSLDENWEGGGDADLNGL